MTPRSATLAVTRTGVRIGCAWTPPPVRADREHQKLQAALLEPRTARPLPPMLRLAGAVWSWL